VTRKNRHQTFDGDVAMLPFTPRNEEQS
jgi:hypothetical protein